MSITGKTQIRPNDNDKIVSLLTEREILRKYIATLSESQDYNLTCDEDAAVVEFPAGRLVVITSDVIIENVHFLPSDPPGNIAKKALRVNLSDLAAMGAHPIGYTLCLTVSDSLTEEWIKEFVQGLIDDNKSFRVSLLGGDINKSPGPLNIAVTAIGDVGEGHSLIRSAAQAGDRIYVTGTIGDAAFGLRVLNGKLSNLTEEQAQFLVARYHLPIPRHVLAQNLREVANSATDISDGLLADLRLICESSHLHAFIRRDRIPISKPVKNIIQGASKESREGLYDLVLSGGDDYELIFTASPGEAEHIEYLAKRYHVPIACIGHLGTLTEPDSFITLLDENGQQIIIKNYGYQHQWNI